MQEKWLNLKVNIQHCERVAFEQASEEEKEMVVEVEMSSHDKYESVHYVLQADSQKDMIENEDEDSSSL